MLFFFQIPSSVGLRGGKVVTRTSLDMELDLQASQTRLSNLKDENLRLRELKKKIEEAKARGKNLIIRLLILNVQNESY